MHTGRNVSLSKIYKFQPSEREQCKNITGLGFATGLGLNLSEMQ